MSNHVKARIGRQIAAGELPNLRDLCHAERVKVRTISSTRLGMRIAFVEPDGIDFYYLVVLGSTRRYLVPKADAHRIARTIKQSSKLKELIVPAKYLEEYAIGA